MTTKLTPQERWTSHAAARLQKVLTARGLPERPDRILVNHPFFANARSYKKLYSYEYKLSTFVAGKKLPIYLYIYSTGTPKQPRPTPDSQDSSKSISNSLSTLKNSINGPDFLNHINQKCIVGIALFRTATPTESAEYARLLELPILPPNHQLLRMTAIWPLPSPIPISPKPKTRPQAWLTPPEDKWTPLWENSLNQFRATMTGLTNSVRDLPHNLDKREMKWLHVEMKPSK
jgi:hypothetical protein